ncbi:hypothetical protein [Saccharicrinis sp. 156]|uniref:hypothetical protein n=1 Tax=Saccharicrinis sp. 156 TaxID=3417574 RepID=UPI003D33A53F
MNKCDATNIIIDGLLGEESIPVKLRTERFFDNEKYSKVKEAVLFLVDEYKDKSMVPKDLALCFVDISNHFYVSENVFSEDLICKIEDAGFELSELANKLFT